jgi:TIR domain/SIR2-like domain
LAARIPEILPRFLRAELRTRSFLFLGHGLAEPDVRALIEHAAGNDRTMRSWAVQIRPADVTFRRAWQEAVQHWPVFGLKVLEADLGHFSAALCRRVAAGPNGPTSTPPPRSKGGPDGGPGIVFVSYPNDIAPQIMKQFVSGMIAGGLKVWLWDPIPYGFSDEEAAKITSLIHGEAYREGALEAARNADAVLFLISPWTLQSKFQPDELSIGLDRGRIVPCIVDEDVGFGQLPAELQRLYVAKITEKSLSVEEGKARLRKLVQDVIRIAKAKREPIALSRE